ncbi:MAG: heme-binding domain-containing protein, partial [Chitinophagales bacterium]|nr:heme-binding domain-containing protein [Chitinophagales bacterium]
MLKKIVLVLLAAFIVIQFIHPEKNTAEGPQPNYIGNAYTVPEDVKSILAKACNDCHSNNTVYPWYAKIQPVDWWLTDHVNDGKKEFNFDEFNGYTLRRQYRKLEECIEQ